MNKRLYKEALKLANRARAVLGRAPVSELKKGVPEDSSRCPIARTIGRGVYVDGSVWSAKDDEFLARGNLTTDEFLRAFDNEEIPELISRR